MDLFKYLFLLKVRKNIILRNVKLNVERGLRVKDMINRGLMSEFYVVEEEIKKKLKNLVGVFDFLIC